MITLPMNWLKKIQNLWALLIILFEIRAVNAQTGLQLDCIERDWFTIFGRNRFDVTSMEIAVSDEWSGMTRLLIAITDWDGEDDRSSKLAYLDYSTCETLFFLKNPQTYQAGLYSQVVYSQDISSVKEYETIYQVGKANDKSEIIVTKIEDGNIELYSYSFDSLDYGQNIEDSFDSICQLTVIETNILLWTHPLGTMLIDLNLRLSRAVHFDSDINTASLITTTDSQRFINTLSWVWSTDIENDAIWVNVYDFNKFKNTKSTPLLIQQNKFSLNDNVEGAIVTNKIDSSVALCYADSSSNLNFGLWEAETKNNLYQASMTRSSNTLLHKGCASIELTGQFKDLQKITAVVYTQNDKLALISFQISQNSKETLVNTNQVLSSSVSWLISNQRFSMFEDIGSMQFRAAPGFLAMNVKLDYQSDNYWGFLLSMDKLENQRRTQLWKNLRYFQAAELSLLVGSSAESQDAYDYDYVATDKAQTSTVTAMKWIFQYNNWVDQLCEQPKRVTRGGDKYVLDYPESQELKFYHKFLIDTDLDYERDSWFRTCFPSIRFMTPTNNIDKFSVVKFKKDQSTILVEDVPNADVFIARTSLMGLDTRYYEQIMYKLQLPPQLASQYMVGYDNAAPRIISPEPFNNRILISIQWAPNPLRDPNALMEDRDGNNVNIIYESNPLFDQEGDKPILEIIEQENLLFITDVFKCELTSENTVRIKIASKMEIKYTGIHKFFFKLTNEGVWGPPNVYQVIIAVGLYEADPIIPIVIPVPVPIPEVIEYRLEKNIVPKPRDITSFGEWLDRRSQSDRKAQLRLQPFTSDGFLRITFTEAVKQLPIDIIEQIENAQLIKVTFIPATFDYDEDEESGSTELKKWSIEEMTENGMLLKFVFKNPNMLSHSIFENDEIKLKFNLTSVIEDGEELFGEYMKAIPLQYPEEFSQNDLIEFYKCIEYAPYAMFGILVMCFILLAISQQTDETAVVWLIISNLQLLIFVPMINIPVPAQVNDMSKEFSKYLRFDFIQIENNQSLADVIAQYIFDFPAYDYQVPSHLEQLGFMSYNSFQTSSGVNLLHLALVIPVFLILMIFGLFKLRCNSCAGPIFNKIHSIFSNNFYIRYNFETFVVYCVCYLMSTKKFTLYNWASSLQAAVTSGHLLWLFSLPLVIVFFYNWHYAKLVVNRRFKAKWGSLYLGLVGNLDKEKSTFAYKYPALQLGRKFFFAFLVVVFHENWICQVGFLFLSTTMLIYIVSMYNPYQSQKLNKLQIVFDTTIIFLGDLMIAFNGGGWLSSDQNVRFTFGWAYIGVFLLCLFIAFMAMLVITFKAVKRACMTKHVKKSKAQKKMEKQKTKALRRQSMKMQTLQEKSRILGSIVPVSNVDSEDSSHTLSHSLNSPKDGLVLQQSDNLLQINADNGRLKRVLTKIEEGGDSEEESSSSLSVSSFSDIYPGEYQDEIKLPKKQSTFIMGQDFLPQIQRKNMTKVRSKTGSRSRSKKNVFSQSLPQSFGGQFNHNKRQLSTPPQAYMEGVKSPIMPHTEKKAKRKANRTLVSESSSDQGSFKADSRINNKGRKGSALVQRDGNRTSKNERTGNSFSQQMFYKANQHESSSHVDQHSDRLHLMSQQDTRRGGAYVKSQQSNRSKISRIGHHQTHPAMSKRSSIMCDDLDDAVSQRLEQMAIKHIENRRQTAVSNSDQSKTDRTRNSQTPQKRRSNYVMGKDMARQSLMEDMTSNPALMSKIHASSNHDLSPLNSYNNEFTYDQEFDPKRLSQQLNLDSRQSHKQRKTFKNDENAKQLVSQRMIRQNKSMINPPAEMKECITPPLEEVSEDLQENKGSFYVSSRMRQDQADQSQNVIDSKTQNERNASQSEAKNFQNKQSSGQLAVNVLSSDQSIEQPLSGGHQRFQAAVDYSQSQNSFPLAESMQQLERRRLTNQGEREHEVKVSPEPFERQGSRKDSKNLRDYNPENPPQIQNLIKPKQNLQTQFELSPVRPQMINIPLKKALQKKGSEKLLNISGSRISNSTNKSLKSMVKHENERYERQQQLEQIQDSKSFSLANKINSPHDYENTPAFKVIAPYFNQSIDPSQNSTGDIRSATKMATTTNQELSHDRKLTMFNQNSSPLKQQNEEVMIFENLYEDPSLQHRRSTGQSTKQKRPTDMPILNLNQDNLQPGVNQRLPKRIFPMQRNNSVNSNMTDMSIVSKFKTLDQDDRSNSPANVKFQSVQK